jgi:hypothetical protein
MLATFEDFKIPPVACLAFRVVSVLFFTETELCWSVKPTDYFSIFDPKFN